MFPRHGDSSLSPLSRRLVLPKLLPPDRYPALRSRDRRLFFTEYQMPWNTGLKHGISMYQKAEARRSDDLMTKSHFKSERSWSLNIALIKHYMFVSNFSLWVWVFLHDPWLTNVTSKLGPFVWVNLTSACVRVFMKLWVSSWRRSGPCTGPLQNEGHPWEGKRKPLKTEQNPACGTVAVFLWTS